jgi:hypothetical protein
MHVMAAPVLNNHNGFGFQFWHQFSVRFFRTACCRSLMRPATGWVLVAAVPPCCPLMVWHTCQCWDWRSHFLSCFLIGVSFWPVFSSSAIRVILNPGAAFVLAMVESFAVEAQVLMLVACHCLCFCVSLVFTVVPLCLFEKEMVACLLLTIFNDLCKIHGVGSRIPRKSLCNRMRNTYCWV